MVSLDVKHHVYLLTCLSCCLKQGYFCWESNERRHEASNKNHSQIPWENYKTDDTIIFLMGLHRLGVITQKLMEVGKPGDFPVAVISRGTTKDEKTVVGTLETIVEKARGLPTPALIVVGEVVKLREQLSWFEES